MHRQQFTLKYITGFRPNELYLSPGLISLHSDFVSNNTQMLLQARAPEQFTCWTPLSLALPMTSRSNVQQRQCTLGYSCLEAMLADITK